MQQQRIQLFEKLDQQQQQLETELKARHQTEQLHLLTEVLATGEYKRQRTEGFPFYPVPQTAVFDQPAFSHPTAPPAYAPYSSFPAPNPTFPAPNPTFPAPNPKVKTTLQVCRDFSRGKCSRPTCSFAHPEGGVLVEEGQVTVCMDARVGKCSRSNCKFYHDQMTDTTANIEP
ncbi:hypothetical protein CYMTET_10758 [Cymbomonas tetramitiformis]|uniref:C3H1-type domain-containing protein n=1 Tax=Cymbomonas tetramitiformis TaxID=36881 RepID=A0AAE0GNI9_9CHLO|nr:hypothetical protein CYMTET_10758 [Cymbomonas tetramitiformis]